MEKYNYVIQDTGKIKKITNKKGDKKDKNKKNYLNRQGTINYLRRY